MSKISFIILIFVTNITKITSWLKFLGKISIWWGVQLCAAKVRSRYLVGTNTIRPLFTGPHHKTPIINRKSIRTIAVRGHMSKVDICSLRREIGCVLIIQQKFQKFELMCTVQNFYQRKCNQNIPTNMSRYLELIRLILIRTKDLDLIEKTSEKWTKQQLS